MSQREVQLNDTFVLLADTLVTGFDLPALMYTLSSTCVDLLGADAAGILLTDRDGGMFIVGSSDERTRVLELFEIQNEQGPCLECHRTGQVVSESDLSRSTRWPQFAPRAVASGFLAVDALPLRLRNRAIGALNLFRTEPGPSRPEDLAAARALADVAAVGLLQERLLSESQLLAEQLQRALDTRVVIEQSKGILAEQGGTSIGDAFTTLRDYSRRQNRTIREVSQDVVDGTLVAADLARRQ